METRYKGNLAGEERLSGTDAKIDTTGSLVLSSTRFDELSKIRVKVTFLFRLDWKSHSTVKTVKDRTKASLSQSSNGHLSPPLLPCLPS